MLQRRSLGSVHARFLASRQRPQSAAGRRAAAHVWHRRRLQRLRPDAGRRHSRSAVLPRLARQRDRRACAEADCARRVAARCRDVRRLEHGRRAAAVSRRRGAADRRSCAIACKRPHRLPRIGAGHLTLGERFRDRGFKDGEIDELRIFDRALTPLEVRNLHDGKALAAAMADPQVASRRAGRILLLGDR